MEQALAGIKVLDLTHFIAGPYCTRLMAGYGAEVIKIEKPGTGDGARKIGPFLEDDPHPEKSGLFLYLNSNKRGITLNLESETGVKIFKEMVKDADVVVENYSPRVMEKLGLDYETLEKINPRLVMTSISNFGQTGPYRDYKSSHLVAWGMSGARYCNGLPGRRPVQAGGWITHYITGLFGAAGTATALYQRNETGISQHVDTSMMESIMLACIYPATAYSYRGIVHHDATRPPLCIFPCKDGYVGINLLTMMQWELICAFFGLPELIDDPRFQTRVDIKTRNDEARAYFAPLIKERDKMELFNSGTEWRIPIGLVPTTKEIVESPQHEAREFFEEVDHPVMGRVTMPGAPFKMMDTPWQLKSPAPLLGEHNEEIYCQRLGYSGEELVKLRERGVI